MTFKNEISHNTLHNELILKAICIEIKIHLRTGSIVNQFKEWSIFDNDIMKLKGFGVSMKYFQVAAKYLRWYISHVIFADCSEIFAVI